MKRILLIFITLLIYGCESQSDVPIRAANGDKFDTRLVGAWTINDDNDHVYLHIGKVRDEDTILTVEHQEDGNMIVAKFPAISACIANGCFLSLYVDSKNDPGYALLKYNLSEPGRLTLQNIDLTFLKSAIKSGKIRGEYSKDLIPDVNLHATEAELRDFVAKYEDKLFTSNKVRFSKL